MPSTVNDRIVESLEGARELSISIADRVLRLQWRGLAQYLGVSNRQWLKHDPLNKQRLISIVDKKTAFNNRAWIDLVSLVPGSHVLPARTAAEFGINRSALSTPDRRMRLFDLIALRRRRKRLRRTIKSLDADLARYHTLVEHSVHNALREGDDGTPFEDLPSYALAARLEILIDQISHAPVPAIVELIASSATARLVELLIQRDHTPAAALIEAASLQSRGGFTSPKHLTALTQVAMLEQPRRAAKLEQWRYSISGWYALHDRLVEASPFRSFDTDLMKLVPVKNPTDTKHCSPLSEVDDVELDEAIVHAQQMVQARLTLAQNQAQFIAAVRAIVFSLRKTLAMPDLFDLTVDELLLVARGGSDLNEKPTAKSTEDGLRAESERSDVLNESKLVAITDRKIRGIPTMSGKATGRVIILPSQLDHKALELEIDDSILVCSHADPAWLPLLMRCAGLVIEQGNVLSDVAAISRKLGLPTVVAVRDAIDAARSARTAHIDADAGLVTFHR